MIMMFETETDWFELILPVLTQLAKHCVFLFTKNSQFTKKSNALPPRRRETPPR